MIKKLFQEWRAYRKVRHLQHLKRESYCLIQAKEFNGKVYLCFDGQSLLPEESLNLPIVNAIAVARATYTDYHDANAPR